MNYRILPTERAWRLAWFLVWLGRQDETVQGDLHRSFYPPFPAWLWLHGQWHPPLDNSAAWLLDGIDAKNLPGAKHRPRQTRRRLTFWGKLRKTVQLIRRYYQEESIVKQRVKTYTTRHRQKEGATSASRRRN